MAAPNKPMYMERGSSSWFFAEKKRTSLNSSIMFRPVFSSRVRMPLHVVDQRAIPSRRETGDRSGSDFRFQASDGRGWKSVDHFLHRQIDHVAQFDETLHVWWRHSWNRSAGGVSRAFLLSCHQWNCSENCCHPWFQQRLIVTSCQYGDQHFQSIYRMRRVFTSLWIRSL